MFAHQQKSNFRLEINDNTHTIYLCANLGVLPLYLKNRSVLVSVSVLFSHSVCLDDI